MKKLLFLVSISIVFFTSCVPDPTEDPDPFVPPATLFLKKTVETGEDYVIVTNYNYTGNKLTSIIGDDNEEPNIYVTYTGDLMTKWEYRFEDGTVDQINLFEYDDTNRLVSFKRLDPEGDTGNKETYVYNSDGTISVTYFIGDATTQTDDAGTGTVTFLNGEVSHITSPDHDYTYVYDNKNNPLKNVLGFSKIAFVDGEGDGVLHNITSYTHTYSGVPFTGTYTYTYSSDFPIESTAADEDGTYTTQYFY